MIEELTQLQAVVLATGGGAVLLPENRERLAARGRVVYLRTPVDRQQLERTRQGRHRPLLAHRRSAGTLARADGSSARPLYESIAAVTVATDGRAGAHGRRRDRDAVEPGAGADAI